MIAVTRAGLEAEFDRGRDAAGLWDAVWMPMDEVRQRLTATFPCPPLSR